MVVKSFGLESAVALMLGLTIGSAQADQRSKYPDWRAQWVRVDAGHGPQFDPTKPPGRAQQAPLTPEYQAIFNANLANLATGAQPYNTQLNCLPPGMPRTMILYEPMEVIVMPDTTYLMFTFMNDLRRIYTDGRDWPKDVEASFTGYSIGKWVDPGPDGVYSTLEAETRYIKGPRTLGTGIPLHEDNRSVVKERISLDKPNPELLRDEITTIDNAFTRPWTVTMTYRRESNPIWTEFICAEGNNHITLEGETYFLSADGLLMPTRKGQPPPSLNLKYFKQRMQ
ncbi:MAG TPA: hypothetical protein VH684_27525 [Xanthobacteraceae bacterium]|jgi:hypothetical protein